MNSTNRPTGQLDRNALGVGGVVFLVMSAVAPLTGLIVVVGLAIALGNGGGMAVSYLVVTAVLLLFAIGYAQMSKRLVNAGGFYAVVVKGLGRMGGLVTGFIATTGYTFFIAAGIGTAGFFMSIVFGGIGINLHWYVWGLASMIVAFLLARSGVHLSAVVLGVALVLEVLILFAFALSVLFQSGFSLEVFSPNIVFTGGLGAGLLLAATSFMGFEATALFSEEARNPLKTIPRATIIAVSGIGFVFALATWAVVSATGVAKAQGVALEHLEAGDLIFTLTDTYLGAPVTTIMSFLLLVSLFAALLAFHNAAARYLFALGRARVLPHSLSKTRANGVPQRALLVNGIFGVVIAGVFALLGLDPITSLVPAFLGFTTLCVLTVQMLAALAIVVYFRRERDPRWWSTCIAPGIGFLGLLGIVIMAISNFSLVAGSDAASIQLLPWLLVVALVGGVIFGMFLKVRKPFVYNALKEDLEKIDETSDVSEERVGKRG